MASPITPKGAKSDKEWRDAIRYAVHQLRADPESGENRKAINMLAETLVNSALSGDVTALKEIGDRLDGKPAQKHEGAGGKGEHVIRVLFGNDA